MVFAMHQIQVACDRPPPRRRAAGSRTTCARLAAEQRLIASVTSEVGTGGDMGRSVAAVTPGGDGALLVREAGADGQLRRATPTTSSRRCAARPTPSPATRSSCSPARDQHDARADRHLGPARDARHLLAGLRRARDASRPSRSCRRRSRAIAAESMVPVSHILWSHVWLGIATDAFDRARAFVRAAAKQQAGRAAAGRGAPLAPDERAVAAARRGRARALRDFVDATRRPRPRAAVDDGDGPALQQPQDRRLRAGPARLPGRDGRLRASSATRTTRRSASAATCATRCRRA